MEKVLTSAADSESAARRPTSSYTAHGESDVQISYCFIVGPGGTDQRPGTQAGCAANPSNQRRQAVDAGVQRAEVGPRLRPGAAFQANAFEPSMGCLGYQPRRRPPHGAFSIQPQ